MNVRDYLCQAALHNQARSLASIPEPADLPAQQAGRRKAFLTMMGIDHLMEAAERPPLNPKVTGELRRDGYRVRKLYFESLPRLYVTCNLYLPDPLADGAPGTLPGILYLCGHEPPQKVIFQAHARRLVRLGFAVLVMETIQRGEIGGHHNGPRLHGWFHWYSRGYTAGGVELWNSIRALDLLESLPEVDGTRLGVTGHSGGGAGSWWLAAADRRIKALAPVCGTYAFASHVCERTVDLNCDCMLPINYFGWELSDVGFLIAPRPLLIASAEKDMYYTLAGAQAVYEKLRPLYDRLGAGEALRWLPMPGPHAYTPASIRAVSAWLLRHVKGVTVPEDELDPPDDPAAAAADAPAEPEETLRVFVAGIPADQRVTRIHEEFMPAAGPPEIETPDQLAAARERTVRRLHELSFRHFPASPPPLDFRVVYETESRVDTGGRFSFLSEEGIRLHGSWSTRSGAPPVRPALVALRLPDEPWNGAEEWLNELHPEWTRVVVEPRGTGDHTWHPQMEVHLRRAAMLTGRTLASLQVWDTLRALEAVRRIPGIDPQRIALAGRGPLAAVALYAALLRGDLYAVVLEDPPATQSASPNPGVPDPPIEMLGCLRITDLPYVAGLLWPAELVFVAGRPAPYRWAEDLYVRLGAPGRVTHVPRLQLWRQERGVTIGDYLAPRRRR